jgi:hypothetical protein
VTGGGHSRSRWLRSSRNRAPAGGGLELSIAGRNDAGLGRARNCRCPASRLPADAGTTVRFANHLASVACRNSLGSLWFETMGHGCCCAGASGW